MPTRSPERRLARDADHRLCRSLIRAGSRSFAAASLLLPADVRQAAIALYAFCRLSDDLVDVDGGSTAAIGRLRQRLDLAYAGRPADHGVDRAFADVVAAYGIPRVLPEALIDGLDWDVRGVDCDSLDDLYAYAACVAGSVGAMMTVLMGAREPATVARACDLGIAMQLTNVARDVGEDARAGRLYLPRSWLRAEGLDPDGWLARPTFNPAIATVVERLLAAAETLYLRADDGIGDLPARCRPGIAAARHLYREIGMAVARRGFDSVSARAQVPGVRKLRLLGRGLRAAQWRRSRPPAAPPLPAAARLVVAVAASAPPISPAGTVADRLVWVAGLFADLEARDRVSGERA